MPAVMAFNKASLALSLLVFVSNCQHNEAQLLANIKSFLGNVPTFGSKDVPKFSTDGQYALSLIIFSTLAKDENCP